MRLKTSFTFHRATLGEGDGKRRTVNGGVFEYTRKHPPTALMQAAPKNLTANGDEQRITALTWDPVNTHAPHCLL